MCPVSSSSTSSVSGRTSTSGVPGSIPFSSTMIPAWSVPRSTSSSARIMPSLISPRTLRRSSCRPFGNTAPGSATATVAPAAKFQAPQTICRASPSPTSTWQSWRRSAFGCFSASSTRPTRKSARFPFRSATPTRLDAVDLARGDHETVGELAGRHRHRHVLAQPAHRDLHQNCLNMRRSFSQNMRMSGMPCRWAAMRSMPRPQAKPDHSSGS